ncbi:hypothetical protein Tsubulata_045226 [Turnera subulata]|uniref:CCHC-type domain-containing protein n=1 Tax=Turnera subulata TaxID=218843 RepID=A0A9Q0GGR0_9ROSI|nr:hypothetical protein Tsubulata_045226 [Turnera subulata]
MCQLNAENAKRIGSAFAGMLDFEVAIPDPLEAYGVLRVKVEFLVDKPLITGFTNIMSEDWQPWVRFKYEDLPELCWFCGRIGHSMNKCWNRKEEEVLPVCDIPKKGYGPWLKAETPNARLYVLPPLEEEAQPAPPAPVMSTIGKTNEQPTNQRGAKGRKIWVPMTRDEVRDDQTQEPHPDVNLDHQNRDVENFANTEIFPPHAGESTPKKRKLSSGDGPSNKKQKQHTGPIPTQSPAQLFRLYSRDIDDFSGIPCLWTMSLRRASMLAHMVAGKHGPWPEVLIQ